MVDDDIARDNEWNLLYRTVGKCKLNGMETVLCKMSCTWAIVRIPHTQHAALHWITSSWAVSLAEYKYHTSVAYSNKRPSKAIVGSSFNIRWTGKECVSQIAK